MQISKYNYVVKGKKYLLYNVLNSACIILDKTEYKQYKNKSGDEHFNNQLLDLGFYIPDNFDETSYLLYKSKQLVDKNKQQFYRIYTTLACNARCPYCYEQGSQPIILNKTIANKICKFIIDNSIPNTRITLEWFGGEPLLNHSIIDYICVKLKPYCDANNIALISFMVSNGLLFNTAIVKKAKTIWNLRRVQITLDGLKETYERIKGFNVDNAFNKVLNNIKLLLDNDIHVTIRLNYDNNNLQEILLLIELLGKQFKKYKNMSIYARRIMGKNIDNSFIASAKTDIVIFDHLLKAGLIKNVLNTIQTRDNTCIANMIHAGIISPNGEIGKCSQAMTDGDIVGDVKSGINTEKESKWVTPLLPSKCLKCKLLPLCHGGCIYEKLLNKPYCFASEKLLKHKLKIVLEANSN